MKRKSKVCAIIFVCSLFASDLLIDYDSYIGIDLKEAEARIGRPATPNSVAGVARRTTRRTIRRTNRYVNSLPRSCTTVVIEGTTLHHCGGTYYQSSGSKYVIVSVN